ncbi:NAD(P)-dependent oxidoreductase [Solihabitans fulvus]|uniref:NAD(P)-dependent oxidoreductase n=1 Tax=Solihabitans fulvus TaxID=1892852 RepID=A0A5B2XKA5_9PSEU|nr:NAD(P)-dependent oxidoreductase [Solihabitans fulvus]KAA2264187.1 NAD(P)-dependent oxidoreductase [Solihabitans fulvus]
MGLRLGIAGGAGFVGTNLARAAVAAGHRVVLVDKGDRLGRYAHAAFDDRVTLLDRDLTLGAAGALADLDAIVNLAALAHVDYSLHFGERVLANNVAVQRTVLDAAVRHGTPVLFTSSIEVYGGNHGALFEESSPRLPLSPYAESKILGEDLVEEYRTHHGVRAAVVRLTNLYGPWQSPDRIVPRIIAQAHAGMRSQVTTGRLRDFLYVTDAVAAILGLVEAGEWGGCHNIAAGKGVTLEEVADGIAARIPACAYDTVEAVDRDGRGPCLVASADRLRSTLDWRPTVELDDGLDRTVHWYARNRPWWAGFDGLLRADRTGPEFLVDFARAL